MTGVQTCALPIFRLRDGIGYDPKPKEGTFIIPANMMPLTVKQLDDPEPPVAPTAPPVTEVVEALRATFAQPQLTAAIVDEVYCPNCGRWVGRNMNVGATAYCPKCKEVSVK